MSSIIPFEYSGTPVRVVERDGEPWFVAKDVADILGYEKSRNAIAAHCKGALKQDVPTGGGNAQASVYARKEEQG